MQEQSQCWRETSAPFCSFAPSEQAHRSQRHVLTFSWFAPVGPPQLCLACICSHETRSAHSLRERLTVTTFLERRCPC